MVLSKDENKKLFEHNIYLKKFIIGPHNKLRLFLYNIFCLLMNDKLNLNIAGKVKYFTFNFWLFPTTEVLAM